MIGIYKITSPSGRVYIGQSINLLRRETSYSKLQDCKHQTRLYNSLVKYGFTTHIFEVIEQCTTEQLNERERHWQDFYDVLSENGLNCKLTKTGDRSGHFSEESKQKNSNTNKGRIPWNKDKQVGTVSDEEKQSRGWGKIVQCSTCNTQIYKQLNQLGSSDNHFCSRDCYTSFRRGQDLGGQINLRCQHCTVHFTIPRYLYNKSTKDSRYCNNACRKDSKNRK